MQDALRSLPNELAEVVRLKLFEDLSMSEVALPLQDLQVDMLSGKPLVLRRFEDDVTEIRIDGRLDEPQWAMVPSFDNLKVVEPDTLVNGRYATDIRMFYTERGLYVSFDMEQPRDTIVKRFSTRDAGRLKRDNVSFIGGSARGDRADRRVDGAALQGLHRDRARFWGAPARALLPGSAQPGLHESAHQRL